MALPPLPPRRRSSRVRLGSVGDTRREMGKLYREMRSGVMDTAKGCKLAFVLQSLGKLIEVETIEQRITALEGKMDADDQTEVSHFGATRRK
jgi:hypothetical protein